MNRSIYRFGSYELEPASRELIKAGKAVSLPPKSFDCLVYLIENRDRAVGRDELISAVWGNISTADSVVAQAVTRARRAVGDSGSKQRRIRTVSRFGYQWIEPIEVIDPAAVSIPGAEVLAADSGAPVDPNTPHDSNSRPVLTGERAPIRKPLAVLVLLALIVAAGLAVFHFWNGDQQSPGGNSKLAVVLPVEVVPDGDEHAWIRLGAMDYIASVLRRNGDMTVVPSEQTMLLAGREGETSGAGLVDAVRESTGARWIVQPTAFKDPGGWRFRFVLSEAGQKRVEFEATAGTPLGAATSASNLLLRRLGQGSANLPEPTELTARLQQIDAELLSGRLAPARALIVTAPESERDNPRLRVREGQLEFRAGRADLARGLFEEILEDPEQLPSEIRAMALMGHGAVSLSEQNFSAAADFYSAAIEVARTGALEQSDPSVVGNAYNGRGIARIETGQVNEGIADFGRARIAMERAGNEIDAAMVSNNIGHIESRRGNDERALREFNLAQEVFERFGVRDNLIVALLSKSQSKLRLVRPAEALEDSQQAADMGGDLNSPRIRGFLDEFHVRALLANGKLTEAGRWLEQSESDQPALDLELLLNLGRFDDALLLAREELASTEDKPSPALVFQAVQAAVLGNDSDLAEEWLRAFPESEGNEGLEFEGKLARALAATTSGDPAESVQQKFATALEAAELQYSELDQMRAGSAFVIYLVREGDLDSASETMGRFSTLAQHDYRAARASLALYQALGHQSLEAEAESTVGKLAGERQSSLPVVF